MESGGFVLIFDHVHCRQLLYSVLDIGVIVGSTNWEVEDGSTVYLRCCQFTLSSVISTKAQIAVFKKQVTYFVR